MKDTDLAEHRKYAWDYFEVHAEQRLKTFNFYLVLAALLITASSTAFRMQFFNPFVGLSLGLLLAFLSYIFQKLDLRNKELIGVGEQALMAIEKKMGPEGQDEIPHVFQLFNREKYQTDLLKKNCSEHYSYSQCFKWVYRCLGWAGLALAIFHVVTFLCTSNQSLHGMRPFGPHP